MPDATRRLAVENLGEAITFAQALDALPGAANAVGFAYTPTAAPWFRWSAEGWTTKGGSPIPAATFELRAFTPAVELRWWRTEGFDRGRAVLLTESSDDLESDEFVRIGEFSSSMLLWGASTGAVEDGWAQLAEGRIGDDLWIPVDSASAGARLRIFFENYVERDRHGNVSIAEQRLVGVGTSPPSRN